MTETPKPHTKFCWRCSRMLYQRKKFVERVIDGHPRALHGSCADEHDAEMKAEVLEHFKALRGES